MISPISTKKCSKHLSNTKICSTFALSQEEMKEKTIFIEVTEEEEELLSAIRNYNKSFPDGYPELLWYAQQIFDNLLRQPN